MQEYKKLDLNDVLEYNIEHWVGLNIQVYSPENRMLHSIKVLGYTNKYTLLIQEINLNDTTKVNFPMFRRYIQTLTMQNIVKIFKGLEDQKRSCECGAKTVYGNNLINIHHALWCGARE